MKKPENELAFQMEVQLLRDLLQPRAGRVDPRHRLRHRSLPDGFPRHGSQGDRYRPVHLHARHGPEQQPAIGSTFTAALPKTCPLTTTPSTTPASSQPGVRRMTRARPWPRPAGSPRTACSSACLNRYAIKGLERRVRGMFVPSIYNHARFFSVWQLKYMLYDLVGHCADIVADRMPSAFALRQICAQLRAAVPAALPVRCLCRHGGDPGPARADAAAHRAVSGESYARHRPRVTVSSAPGFYCPGD